MRATDDAGTTLAVSFRLKNFSIAARLLFEPPVVRMEPRAEEGTERVGIGAIIEGYDFVRAKPTPV